ncbi:UNVERIFIED_CONTAM: hypothetical protein Sradi_7217400 [Sesamum radiatum]|uniref:Reverse transcriptase domain-containing protein n=1 Tax=Sesamum radiatum TaxID=300843 RepID=A0AAW2INU9_SESRA
MIRSRLASSPQEELIAILDLNMQELRINALRTAFHEQLGRNMEVYIDDMLVKNRQMYQHLADLAEAFGTLRKFHMKLRPAKCAFGVRTGKFLGYMVIEKMIEVNLEQIRVIQEMKHPHNLNEIQILA